MTRVWIDTIARLVVFILLLILTFLWNKFSAISLPCDTTVLLLRGYRGVSKKLHPLPHRGGLKKIPGGYFWGSLLGNDAKQVLAKQIVYGNKQRGGSKDAKR